MLRFVFEKLEAVIFVLTTLENKHKTLDLSFKCWPKNLSLILEKKGLLILEVWNSSRGCGIPLLHLKSRPCEAPHVGVAISWHSPTRRGLGGAWCLRSAPASSPPGEDQGVVPHTFSVPLATES